MSCVASGVSAVAGSVVLGSHDPVAVPVCGGGGGGVAAGNGDPASSPLTGRRGHGRCEEVTDGVDAQSSAVGGHSWR